MTMTSPNSGFAPWSDRLRRSAIILIATALGLAASVMFGGLTLPQAGLVFVVIGGAALV
ncbi:MAG TPA: two-component sensor histidine kinase, partial [Afipia sp.]|nr:two-component sensor histidine kinase [Afipia sp.]